MNEKEPENRGLPIKMPAVGPAIKLEWISELPPGPRVTGRFITRAPVRPAIEKDSTGSAANPPATLELMFDMDPGVNAVELASGVVELLAMVNQLERHLGGAGLTQLADQRCNGTVTLKLAPDEATGAEARIRQVCDILNQPTKPPELSLPAAVMSIAARVA